jgi:flagellar hook protein FlgE
MAFQSGLSGLNTASKNLDVIGNNVANASVVGFKGSVAQFADVFAASLGGGGASQIGIGSKVQNISQTFSQGNVTPTNNPLDIAITGRGFFRLEDNGTVAYSRNGQFRLDSQGFMVNSEGLNLTGHGVDSSGNIVNAQPTTIQFDSSDIAPRATAAFDAGVNLDSRATVPTVATFDPTNAQSFNYTTSGTTYDTLGNPHVLTLFFVRTATAGQWSVHATVDGTAATNVNLGSGAGVAATINFSSSGALTTTMPFTASLAITTGAVTPLAMTLDLSGSTQYGATSSVNTLIQDGYTSGRLTGFNISSDGIIIGRYSNGQTRTLGQVVLADFVNPQGLAPLGNNLWQETGDSGLALVGTPNTGTLGNLQSSAVEDSNVDLTAELVNMITAQRNYQANAQTIKTMDAVLQTLVNLR